MQLLMTMPSESFQIPAYTRTYRYLCAAQGRRNSQNAASISSRQLETASADETTQLDWLDWLDWQCFALKQLPLRHL